METGPIFIGGLANTGKTELRLMLEAHPHLCFTRRTYMWTRFYERFGDLGRPENLEKCLTAMLAHEPIRQLQPDLARIRAEFAQASPTYARLFGLFHAHHAVRMGKPLGRSTRPCRAVRRADFRRLPHSAHDTHGPQPAPCV